MCTVTIVPLGGSGYRLACNRDESKRRPTAWAPVFRRFDERLAAMPIDSVSGGTWVAVNDAGVAMALLNANPVPGERRPGVRPGRLLESRGLIIPALLDAAGADQAVRAASRRLDPEDYAPFRLVIVSGAVLGLIESDGATVRCSAGPFGPRPRFFTSSSLGDLRVEGPRRRLFDAMLLGPGDARSRQDAFHRHSWPDRPELSVCMKRPGAATVSHTVIEVEGAGAGLTYHPGDPDDEEVPISLRLRLDRRAPAPRVASTAWAS